MRKLALLSILCLTFTSNLFAKEYEVEKITLKGTVAKHQNELIAGTNFSFKAGGEEYTIDGYYEAQRFSLVGNSLNAVIYGENFELGQIKEDLSILKNGDKKVVEVKSDIEAKIVVKSQKMPKIKFIWDCDILGCGGRFKKFDRSVTMIELSGENGIKYCYTLNHKTYRNKILNLGECRE